MDKSGQPQRQEKEYEQLPIIDILASSTYVGAASGVAGLLVGSIGGVLRSPNPVLFSVASGVQCFGLGTIFSTTRQFVLLQQQQQQQSRAAHDAWTPTQRQQTAASGIAGAVAGAGMGGLVRGRANVLPGGIVWALVGVLGQEVWNANERARGRAVVEQQQQQQQQRGEGGEADGRSFWARWSPMKLLTDEEYEGMLRDRLLRVDAEIAILDEDLQKLKAEQVRLGSGRASS